MAENPHRLDFVGIPDEEERRLHAAWQQGHDSRDAEVAALKAELAPHRALEPYLQKGLLSVGEELIRLHEEVKQLINERDAAIREVGEANRALGALQLRYDELRSLSLALVRATRQSLQGEATVSVAEGAADEVEGWLEEHR